MLPGRRLALVYRLLKKATLSLVGAVAFLMLIFRSRMPDTDDRHDDAYDRDYNTDNADHYL